MPGAQKVMLKLCFKFYPVEHTVHLQTVLSVHEKHALDNREQHSTRMFNNQNIAAVHVRPLSTLYAHVHAPFSFQHYNCRLHGALAGARAQ